MNIAIPFHYKMLLVIAAMHVILNEYLYVNAFEKKISVCVHFLITVVLGFFNNLLDSVEGLEYDCIEICRELDSSVTASTPHLYVVQEKAGPMGTL